jgi:beta-1,4-N-acetylglucosaminyltransferase
MGEKENFKPDSLSGPMLSSMTWILITILACVIAAVLLRKRQKQFKGEKIKAFVVLGSGGHTTEMLSMLSSLTAKEFSSYVFLIAATDNMSEIKLRASFSNPEIRRTPRAREVGQSWLSSIFTTAIALFYAIRIVWTEGPDLILTNGPGTCVPVAYTAWILRLLCIKESRIVFVESVARVKSLSLSGKLLYPIADRFLVQWPGLIQKYPRAKFVGFVI